MVGQLPPALDGELQFLGRLAASWLRLLAAAAALLVAWYAAKLLARLLRPAVEARFRRVAVVNLVLRSLRAGVMLVAVFSVANALGVSLGNVLLSVTVVTAAATYVMAPILVGLIDGLFVLVNRPYEIGDYVELLDGDVSGFVEDITLRYTKLHTLDNTTLLVANDTIRRRDVVNYTDADERARRSVELRITYESDIDAAREAMERAARETDGVIEGGPEVRIGGRRYPASPLAFIREFDDHGVLLDLRFWVDAPYAPLAVRSAVHERIWDGFADADVELAYPHTHHVFDETSGRARVDLGGERSDGERPDPERSRFDD